MPRRRTRRPEPVEVEEEEEEQVQDSEDSLSPPPAEQADDVAVPENSAEATALHRLHFDEELSWRPAKPISSATLIARLERLSQELAGLEQGEVDLDTLNDVAASLAHRNLLQHKDGGVKAYTACCLVDVLRLFAPDAPYDDEQLKMIFTLIIKDIIPALRTSSDPYNSQHKYVLMSLADVKSHLLICFIHGADEFLLRLFNAAFDSVSVSSKTSTEEQVAKDVEIHLTEMLVEVVDESPGSVPASVVDAIISQFLRAAPPGGGGHGREHNDKQTTLLLKSEPPAYVMAKNICNACADKMSRYVSQYFSDVILNASGFATKKNEQRHGADSDEEDTAAHAGPSEADLKSLRQAHLLIRELWRAAPTILQNVVPQLDAELSADNVHLRLIATETFGYMISGIGAAGVPPPPVLDPTAYPPLRLLDETPSDILETNVLAKPFSPQSFSQTHHATYRNFVGRKNDKVGLIRAAWVTAAGHVLSTGAGGIGLSREEESELVKGLVEKLNDSEEKVRLAAVKAVELFSFRDAIAKLGAFGGVEKDGSVFASLADRCRDRKPAVRVDAMVLLGKLWAVGSGEIAEGQEAAVACLSGVPSRIINVFYANDPDLNVLLDRVVFECLLPLKFPLTKGKAPKSATQASQGKGGGMSAAEQDRIRAERILLMLKLLDAPAQKAFLAMQARQPQFAKGVGIFIQQCEAYNGGVVERNEDKVKASLAKTLQWLGASFPDPLKVRSDLQKFAKLNDRRSYQLIKYTIESDNDFKTVRRAINELIAKLKTTSASVCLDTLIPLLYRSSCLMFNRSHLTTIMDYSKSDKNGLAGVAHLVLNDISQRNPDVFKAHAEDLRKEILDQAPTDSRSNDPAVVDILKAYSSYARRYPDDVDHDKSFSQTLVNYALYGSPAKSAKHAITIILAKNDDKGRITATNVARSIMQDIRYGGTHFLARLAALSQLERLAPNVTADWGDAIRDFALKQVLREVRTESRGGSDPGWVNDDEMDEELRAKCLCMHVFVNSAIANEDEDDAEERVKPVFKLLKDFIVNEGEFCKTKDTPLHHKKRLRLLAGLLILKLCTIKKYDEQFDAPSFNKLALLVQDSEVNVRRRFMEKLQSYLTQAKLRARFHTILFVVAYEPVTDLKDRVETWLRSRARYYAGKKQQILEAIMGRLIPLLAHHPDFSPNMDDILDFARYFFFYLGTVATEDNISLIHKYAERVKQTRDAVNPDASENLYVLSDLAQAVVRKFQEKRNWSFQAWAGKVGLPTGLYAALPSSDVAQQIAKKQYISDEIDDRLDDLLRVIDRKKKRKSLHEKSDPPAKKARTQTGSERTLPKTKGPKSSTKKKATTRKPRTNKEPSSPQLPPSERRRSSRAHKVSDYKERDDADDEEEMLDGVAEWDYEVDPGSSDAEADAEASSENSVESDEVAESKDEDEDEEDRAEEDEGRGKAPSATKRNGTKHPENKGKMAASGKPKRAGRPRGGKRTKASPDMDMSDYDD